MSKHSVAQGALTPAGWPSWAKVVVSILILFHFFAIFLAVTAEGGPDNSPELSRKLYFSDYAHYTNAYPYLRTLFLTNAYRFFAPNPGWTALVWFRVQYADGSVRWFEIPRAGEFVLRMPYQRRLALALQVGQNIMEYPPYSGRSILTVYGRAYVSSFVRHVARMHAPADPAETPGRNIDHIRVFKVDHMILLPVQVWAGWDHTDLRNYRYTYVGAYQPDGTRQYNVVLGDGLPLFRQGQFAAQVLVADVYPVLERKGDLADLALPPPIRKLLKDFPELRNPDIQRQLLLAALERPDDKPEDLKSEIDFFRGRSDLIDAIKNTPGDSYHSFLQQENRLTAVLERLLEAKIEEIVLANDKPPGPLALPPPVSLPRAGEKPQNPQQQPPGGLKTPGKGG